MRDLSFAFGNIGRFIKDEFQQQALQIAVDY